MPRRRDFDADAPGASSIETATARATATAAVLRTRRVSLERRQSAAQPLVQLDLRLPAEDLARTRDVRLAHLRVVDRQRLVEDLARRPGRRQNGLGEWRIVYSPGLPTFTGRCSPDSASRTRPRIRSST